MLGRRGYWSMPFGRETWQSGLSSAGGLVDWAFGNVNATRKKRGGLQSDEMQSAQ